MYVPAFMYIAVIIYISEDNTQTIKQVLCILSVFSTCMYNYDIVLMLDTQIFIVYWPYFYSVCMCCNFYYLLQESNHASTSVQYRI